jgi:hypothetical protein
MFFSLLFPSGFVTRELAAPEWQKDAFDVSEF